MGKRTLSASKTHNSTECAKAHLFLRVPLFNLSEAGRGFLTSMFYPRLRSLRSLSLGILRIKPRRGFALAERNTIMRIPRQVEEYNLRNMCYRYDPMHVYLFSRRQLFFRLTGYFPWTDMCNLLWLLIYNWLERFITQGK